MITLNDSRTHREIDLLAEKLLCRNGPQIHILLGRENYPRQEMFGVALNTVSTVKGVILIFRGYSDKNTGNFSFRQKF